MTTIDQAQPATPTGFECAITVDPSRRYVNEWRSLNSIHGHVQSAATDALSEVGLSLVEFTVLDILEEQVDRHMRMQDVALVAGLTTGATTRLVNRLEDRGLLARYLCTTDRRGIYTEITSDGSKLLARARTHHDAAIARILSDADVARALSNLADTIRPR